MALCQVADVVLVKIFIKGGSQQFLGQVGEDGGSSGGTHKEHKTGCLLEAAEIIEVIQLLLKR